MASISWSYSDVLRLPLWVISSMCSARCAACSLMSLILAPLLNEESSSQIRSASMPFFFFYIRHSKLSSGNHVGGLSVAPELNA